MINYYQNHKESLAEIAIKFDVLSSQVYLWKNDFEKE
ncbi:helix-turn-helix domain-containing protein [Limosilactobacillus sp. BG-MG3-A]|uniref:Helix-turn-helix domain-containing protein n=1 Tax=Limosilactobacillus agrestis TaxID=2759748 RepID=A0A7W3YLC6_9LACO|nr:helix-turn-helix domain-containing protein [Limosilactobacillus agrestis]MBB1099455.1 helix-turn-helix domain-containing protein [Limosilactobacillus agrestis]MBD5090527.1 helix-turn-helix domain-containing protein [Lactobacillus sp.]